MWEGDRAGYVRKYFHGEKGRTNRGQAFGREFAEALESGEETGRIEVDLVLAQVPKLAIRDKIMEVKVLCGKGKARSFIPVVIRPDMCSEDLLTFYEIKTGAGPWTQKMADESDQISFYTAGLYLMRGGHRGAQIPLSELVWAPTETVAGEDGVARPHLTGEVYRFPTSRTFADILRIEARISRAWREIGEAMESELL